MTDFQLRRAPLRLLQACWGWGWVLVFGWAGLAATQGAHAQASDSPVPATLTPSSPASATPATVEPSPSSQAQASPQGASPLAPNAPAASATSGLDGPSDPTSHAWQRLSKRQKQALAPLASSWDVLTAVQQQKWLTLSRGFLQLSDEEQMTLHARMSDWAALSPKQRNQARFHFNSTQNMPIDDKRSQWEAYQQLSAQDKQQLSSGPKPPIKSTARSTQPPSPRLVRPPAMPANGERAIQRIASARAIDPKTLLPQTTQTNRPAGAARQ